MAKNIDERTVRLRLICVTPSRPAGITADTPADFGLQHGMDDVRPGEEQPDGSLRFEFEARVKQNPTTGMPNFLGAYTHGTAAVRFVYLSWRRAGGGSRD
jgi:hypothetical protein